MPNFHNKRIKNKNRAYSMLLRKQKSIASIVAPIIAGDYPQKEEK